MIYSSICKIMSSAELRGAIPEELCVATSEWKLLSPRGAGQTLGSQPWDFCNLTGMKRAETSAWTRTMAQGCWEEPAWFPVTAWGGWSGETGGRRGGIPLLKGSDFHAPFHAGIT